MGKTRKNPPDSTGKGASPGAVPARSAAARAAALRDASRGRGAPEPAVVPSHPEAEDAPKRRTFPVLLGLEGPLRNQRFGPFHRAHAAAHAGRRA